MNKIIGVISTFLIFALATTSTAISATNSPDQTFAYSEFNDEDDEDFDFYESDTSAEIYDPLEKINRKIYVFNDTLDRYFLEHVALFYRNEVPDVARISIHNFLNNLTLPLSVVNSLMQGKLDNGLATFSNFLINSTLGIGGLIDVAGNKNIQYQSEDFGQTLGYYGMGSGAYLMIPFFGPSSTRDLSGMAFDSALDPLKFNLFKIAHNQDFINDELRFIITGMTAIDNRERLIDVLNSIKKESFDPYATIRSAYLQKRESDIKF